MNLTSVMADFVRLAPVTDYTRTTLGPHLPDEVQELFEHGVGYIGDGMVRTVDPLTIAQVTSRLSSPLHASHAFPILTTAFADIVTYWRSRLYLVNSRVGRYIGLGRSARLPLVIAELTDPATRDFLMGDAPWSLAVHTLGVPTPRECFGYVPPLAVHPRRGGDITGLERVDLLTHLEFLADFYGPTQGRW